MSEHLKEAETCLNAAAKLLGRAHQNDAVTSAIWQQQWALRQIHQHLHLEAQQETQASETHSLAATSTQEAIQGSLAISTALSEGISVALTESQAGNLWRYLAEGTLVSCSLVLRHGEQQAAAIFTTRTHKGATPPTSFESLTLAVNGAAGNAS